MNLNVCYKNCERYEHGRAIIAALTKRAVTDGELCAYLNHICELCGSSKDSAGRSSLHIAASCGRTDVCKWLLCQKLAKIDEKDFESGYTALHRSIFYGKIDTAVALIKLGANQLQLDANSLTPLDHVMKDNFLIAKPGCRLIFLWGSNSNYTLGTGKGSEIPELFESFHRIHPKICVKQILLEKFHTVILTEDGVVYTFGHGQGGRLGLGSENTILEPTPVKFPSTITITKIAIARDHCLFLTNTEEVFSCGLNTHLVLGVRGFPPNLLTPRHVNSIFNNNVIKGIAAGRYHSVAWGDKCLYTWGLHGGQLGHDYVEHKTHVEYPKLVNCLTGSWTITEVVACQGATAVATSRGDIYVLHEFLCRKIASRQLDILTISMFGGRLTTLIKIDQQISLELKVTTLTKTGTVLIWQELDMQQLRCKFSLNRRLIVRQLALHINGLMILTTDREVFHGKIVPRKKKTQLADNRYYQRFIDRKDDECVSIKLERIGKLHTADFISSDLEGQNFAALQLNTRDYLTKIPEVSPSSFTEDFNEILTSEETSDMTFRVGGRVFPCHKYIVGSSSEKMRKLLEEKNEIVLDVNPKLLEQVLQFIYTSSCDLFQVGACRFKIEELRHEGDFETKDKKSVNNPLRLLQELAKRLGFGELQKRVDRFGYDEGEIRMKAHRSPMPVLRFEWSDLPEYYDVEIESKNGKIVKAHKCVLASRSEFFRSMFSARWDAPTMSFKDLPYPQNILSHLLNYCYTDHVDLEKEDIDTICNLFVASEYLLISRLQEICELALSKLMTFKNVFKIITLAHYYSAEQLKNCCMEYICLNLAATLETHFLEELDDEILKDLSKFYCDWNEKLSRRVITPYSHAPTDEDVKWIAEIAPIDMSRVIKTPPKINARKRHRAHKQNATGVDETNFNLQNPILERSVATVKSATEAANATLLANLTAARVKKDVHSSQRVQAIQAARAKLEFVEEQKDGFVKLGDFPDLGSLSVKEQTGKSPKNEHRFDKHRRMSQKERKRLSSEGATASTSKENFESPKNPWKTIERPEGGVEAVASCSNIGNIISEEKKQKENLNKIRSKGLIFTQTEDKALEDLRKFYNADNVDDEIIVAERVDVGLIAAPVWVQK